MIDSSLEKKPRLIEVRACLEIDLLQRWIVYARRWFEI